jgi:transposase
MENYLLPFNVDLNSQRLSDLKRMINEERIMNFLKIWSKQKQEHEYLAYDTTSISTSSNNIEEAEFGFNKDYDDMKQINLALLSSYTTGIPYFYRIVNGSIKDVTTLTNLVKYSDHINLKNVKLVMDRGFYKNSNLSLLNINKINYIMGLPFSNLHAKLFVDNVIDRIGNPSNYFRVGKKEICYAITQSAKIEEESIIVHVYLDKIKKIQLEENFMADIDAYQTINKGKL